MRLRAPSTSRCRTRSRTRPAPAEPAGNLRPMVAGLARTWWSRPGLEVRGGRLFVAGRDAEAISRSNGTPVFVMDLVRVQEQAVALPDALPRAGLRGGVRPALQAGGPPTPLGLPFQRHAL